MRDPERSCGGGKFGGGVSMKETTGFLGKKVLESVHSALNGLALKRIACSEPCGTVVDNKTVAIA